MNERLHQLMRQAQSEAYANACAKNKTQRPQNNTIWNEFPEVFAELIIRECMSLMKERKDYYDNPGTYETEKYYIRMDAKADAFDDASSIIKNHFGVEE